MSFYPDVTGAEMANILAGTVLGAFVVGALIYLYIKDQTDRMQ